VDILRTRRCYSSDVTLLAYRFCLSFEMILSIWKFIVTV